MTGYTGRREGEVLGLLNSYGILAPAFLIETAAKDTTREHHARIGRTHVWLRAANTAQAGSTPAGKRYTLNVCEDHDDENGCCDVCGRWADRTPQNIARQAAEDIRSEGSGPAGQLTAEWKDDPEVRDAMARAAEVLAILALPDEEEARAGFAACGLYPVAVVHGELDSDEAVELITGRMARAAERLGCRHKSGGNDATTYLFPSHDAAVDFLAEVTGFAKSWWTVTATARPVYNRGGAW
jgi:hypothetical protein